MSQDAGPGVPGQEVPQLTPAAGLPPISRRAGDFAAFRQALLRPLPGEQAIGSWRPAPGDLGLQVLEWWAYLADVLTFYNAQYASESYLPTARQPSSVANLAALLGYVPAPGIAATGNLAAMAAPGAAGPLVIPAGMQLSSTASAGVPSQTFEVDEKATLTGPSAIPVAVAADDELRLYPDSGVPRSVLIAGRLSGVRPGDRLVLVHSQPSGQPDTGYWWAVTVASLAPEPDPATGVINTRAGFAPGGLGPTAPPGPDRPAPPRPPSDSTRYRLLRPAAAASIFNPAALGVPERQEPPIVFDPKSSAVQRVHLSAAVRGISPGDLVLFDCGAGIPSALAVVTGSDEVLWAVPYPEPGTSGGTAEAGTDAARRIPRPPDIVIAHTVLGLQLGTDDSSALLTAAGLGQHGTADATTTGEIAAIASIAVRYGLRDVGTIIGTPAADLRRWPAHVTAAAPPPADGRPAYLQDATGAGVLVTTSADAGQPAGRLTLTPAGAAAPPGPLAVPLRLLPHLIPVSRGTTVTGEVLGSGNAALARQSFTLAKSPLTYLPGAGGQPASTLIVSVDQIEWQEVPGFYGQGPGARVYVVTRSPDQAVTTVAFGDGVNGARLPSGTGNVVASYRYGSAAASPPAGQLTTIRQPQLNLASIQNPVAVTGGMDPQGPADVRAAAPASAAMLGRAVSATDYQQMAAAAAGVSRAAAFWMFDRVQQRTLVTVCIGDDAAAVTAAKAALAGAEDPNRPVQVIGATPVGLTLSCVLEVAAGRPRTAAIRAAKAAVSASAGGLFSPALMGIGQRLYRSAIDAALMVPGVLAIHDLTVTGPSRTLGESLDPGQDGYFTLAAEPDISAVTGHG